MWLFGYEELWGFLEEPRCSLHQNKHFGVPTVDSPLVKVVRQRAVKY